MRQSCGTPARTNYPRAEEIELEIEKENKEKGTKVPDMIGPSAYERVTRAGLRCGKHGEPVPSRDRRILRDLEQRKTL